MSSCFLLDIIDMFFATTNLEICCQGNITSIVSEIEFQSSTFHVPADVNGVHRVR